MRLAVADELVETNIQGGGHYHDAFFGTCS
jgi:hypothetical protein